MATPIKFKRSAVANKRPTIDIIGLGELALNTYDGKLFTEQDTGGVGIGTTVTMINPWSENYGGASIYYNNLVGIGKTNVGYPLEVVGRTELDDVNVTGIVTSKDLYTTGITTLTNLRIGNTNNIDVIRDEDNMASDDPNALATQQSIKKYVDDLVTAQDLDFIGDSGTGSVDLDSQSLDIEGTNNEIETLASNQKIKIGLPDNVTIGNNLTVTNDLTVSNDASVTGDATVGGNLDISDTIYHTGDSNTKIRFPANDTITLHTSGDERFRVTGIGSVGIGTNVPASDAGFGRVLEVEDGTSSALKLSRTTGNISAELGIDASQLWLGSNSSTPLKLATNGNPRITIFADGKVGINSTSAGHQLYVAGRSDTEQLNVIGLSTFVGIATFPSNHVYIDNKLFVGGIEITPGAGITTPNLDINDYIRHNGDLTTKFGFPAAEQFRVFIANNAKLDVMKDGATVTGILTASNGLSVSGITTVGSTIVGPSVLTIDPAAQGDNTGKVVIKGDLQVDGTQTIVNSSFLEVADKVIGIASVTTPTNVTANDAGIEVYGASNKTLKWLNTGGGNWTASENFDIVTGKVYKIGGTEVLSGTTLTIPNITVGVGGTTIKTNSAGQVGIGTVLSPAPPSSVLLDVDGTINSTTSITVNGVPVQVGAGEDPVAMAIALG